MYRIEPFGDDWLQAASIVAKIHNTQCREKIKPTDVIPQFVSNQPAATPEQSQAFFKTFGSAVKATNRKSKIANRK